MFSASLQELVSPVNCYGCQIGYQHSKDARAERNNKRGDIYRNFSNRCRRRRCSGRIGNFISKLRITSDSSQCRYCDGIRRPVNSACILESKEC